MPLPEFWNHQPLSEVPFLLKMRNSWKENKSLKGFNILQNLPLSLESLCKIDALLEAGANVTVTRTKTIHPSSEDKAIAYLPSMGVGYVPEHEELQGRDSEFDFLLDCGAELAKVLKPRKGIVEITQTGTQIYRGLQLDVPVISVDDSYLKGLETFYGTGDGFIRSFVQHSKSSLKDKVVLLFGYGKVGSGVANAFLTYTKNITVVDISALSLQKAYNRNIKALSFEEKAEITKAISNADIVVTATGVKNIISNTFEHDLFKGKFLANVGVEDEYGYAFEKNEILGSKMPLNFLLDEPTKMRYLDPSFYAHNLGCELIMQRNLTPGYHPFPPDVDIAIIKEWQDIFKEDLSLLGLPFLSAA